MEKPHFGRIKDWRFCQNEPNAAPYISGYFLDHPLMRGTDGYTSRVVKYDADSGEIETRNSRYRLVSDGEMSAHPGFPKKHDTMRFLGKNGREHQLAEALMVFKAGEAYEVESCHVGAWDHSVTFFGIGGHWNGVMFELVPEGEGNGPRDPAEEH